MYIKRHIEEVLLRYLKQYPCVLVTGPRQVGKSTLIKNLPDADTREYVTLDDTELRHMAKTDPKGFLQIHKPPICIDEIQLAPELFSYVKISVDQNKNPGDYIFTGSQMYKLMRNIDESLAGRLGILNMQGISQSEISLLPNQSFFPQFDSFVDRKLKPMPDIPKVFERIFTGSMPDIVSGRIPKTTEYYPSYLSTFLQKDISQITKGIDELKFRRFLTACACRSAQLLNVADIARDAEIDPSTASGWLDILETIGIVFYLHPYSNNLLKRTVKKPKMYFYDTGLVSYLCKWQSPQSLMVGAQAGAIFETYVVSEIIKSYFNAGAEPFVYYYRDIDAKEIDLILERDMMLFPIEIKKSASADSRDTKSFSVISKSGLKQGTGAVISLRDNFLTAGENLLFIPVALI